MVVRLRQIPTGLRDAAFAAVPLTVLSWLALFSLSGQRLDSLGLDAAAALDPVWREAAVSIVLAVHGGGAVIAIAAVSVAVAAGVARLHHGIRVEALAVAVVVVTVLPQLGKLVLTRTIDDGQLTLASFPSGHVAAAVGVAALCVCAVAPEGSGSSRVMAAAIAGWAAIAAVVVVWSLGHRPADVIASLLLVDLVVASVRSRTGLVVRRHAAVVGWFAAGSLAVTALEGVWAVLIAGAVCGVAILVAAAGIGCTLGCTVVEQLRHTAVRRSVAVGRAEHPSEPVGI